MKNKKIGFSTDARTLLEKGVDTLVRTVSTTLGPNGRNVIIEQENGQTPISTKDGVTAAKSVKVKQPIENIGIEIVRQASIKTGDQAGDGTTTSTVLAGALINKGIEKIEAEHKNTVEIKRGIDTCIKDVVQYLEEQSTEITNQDQLRQVATISGNNDPEVGELITSAMEDVGQEGIITIEESRTGETYLETVEGMQLRKGYKSPYFVTDNKSMSTTLEEPVVLITDQKIHKAKDILPLMQMCSAQDKSLVIVADDISGEALSTLVVNKARGILTSVAIQAPEFGDRKIQVLQDLATVTGGTVISKDKGMKLTSINSEHLGTSRKVTVDKDSAVFIDGGGSEEDIASRAEDIKALIDKAKSPYEIEILQDRLGRMAGGVGVIHVGGYTEVEMREKKDRVEDALHATRAALEEGILPGGGTALLYAGLSLLDDIDNVEFTHPDQKIGYLITLSALREPIAKILFNALDDEAKVEDILKVLKSENEFWKGYNPRVQDYRNMFEEGIIDPKKVTRLALENAGSVAGTLLTTECVVSILEEEKENNNEDQQLAQQMMGM